MSRARYVGLAKEGTYGTAESEPARFEDAVCSIQPNLNWIMPDPVSKRAYQKRTKGLYRARGNIGEFEVTPEGIIGELLYGVFGSISTSPITEDTETVGYIHEFSPSDTLPSYTVFEGVELTERVLPGGLFNSLTLKWSAGDVVKCTCEALSGFPESTNTIRTPTIDTLKPFTQVDDLVNLTMGGDQRAVYLSDLEVTINNNIPFNRGDLDGRTFNTKRVGQRTVEGRFTAYFDDEDDFNRFKNGTAFDIIIGVATKLLPDASNNYYSIGVNLYECQLLQNAAPDIVRQNNPLVINAPFRAFYDTGESLEVKAFLQNNITSYS